jgi:hypothetical protein
MAWIKFRFKPYLQGYYPDVVAQLYHVEYVGLAQIKGVLVPIVGQNGAHPVKMEIGAIHMGMILIALFQCREALSYVIHGRLYP